MTAAPPSDVLPIDAHLPAIRAALQDGRRLVLEAPPGAGKTTRVPLTLLDADWLDGRRIVMLEPRRIAARSAARFMAEALGEAVGETVGYRIRMEKRVGPRTRIEVVTEGILTRMLQDDPTLDGIGAVLFDEFHERHLQGDLGLALCLDVQEGLRDDLRIVVMSATLDGERLTRWLDAKRVSSAGLSYPVTITHPPAQRDDSVELQVRRAVVQAVAEHPGDVLVFLPGRREIERCQRLLVGALPPDCEVDALHGELAVDEQARLLRRHEDGRRRVVLATNVAESSVTLPGVRVVVDSGLAREPRFDPNSGFARLATVTISQASADQRAGRAGRVAEGWCTRLWPASQRLDPQRRAEIGQVELTGLALELAAWGSSTLQFPDALPAGPLTAARDLLRSLGALAGDAITPLGRRMLALGTHPRLAAMLLGAPDALRGLACDLAALVEGRSPLRGGFEDRLAARWQALHAHRAGRGEAGGSRAALSALDAVARQLRSRVHAAKHDGDFAAHDLGDALAFAFPDRIARQHPGDPRRYQLANGQTATLGPDSGLFGEAWLVIAELRLAEGDSRVLLGAPTSESWLRAHFADRFTEQEEVRWDSERRAITAARVLRFAGIVLDSKPANKPDPARCAAALIEAVRALGLDALPWSDGLRQWQARVELLRATCPDLELPAMHDAALLVRLDDWLGPVVAGKTRLDAISTEALGDALRGQLEWAQRQQVDQLAPPRIDVPSGMQRAITYALDAEPVLAVKLQELFGLVDTPTIARGRVPLTLHLLSPAGRPLQVTRDLKGFWERTYPEVKREMKGRYPKHPWPDDPWTAAPTHRAKPRSR